MKQQFEESQDAPIVLHQDNEIHSEELIERPEAETVESLLEALKLEAPKRVKRRRKIILACCVGFTLWFVLMAMLRESFHGMNPAFFSYMSFVPMVVAAMAATEGQKKLVKQLAQYDDKRAVGPLIEALMYNDPATVAAAKTALTRLLPELRASDRHLLNTEQRAILNTQLLMRGLKVTAGQSQLALSILTALGQVGDAGAFTTVEKVANGAGIGKDPSVRMAATECLPFLEEAARLEEASHTLLRASAPGASPEALLRPASSGPESHAEQLLRAAGPAEE